MMHFIQSVQHYLVMDVIENSWHVFLENMRAVKTVEEVPTERVVSFGVRVYSLGLRA
jgi:hypothetical protein